MRDKAGKVAEITTGQAAISLDMVAQQVRAPPVARKNGTHL